ncbi:putative phosphatase regulatory subunit-domain-containing protein [Dissophora ornata]|nr:hypothetical protein BGZ58_004486 [Dissophora ornata]KAI8594674.1 putative phosphatase regulatory subunit-domain-containing protein [Dissophora ornata]
MESIPRSSTQPLCATSNPVTTATTTTPTTTTTHNNSNPDRSIPKIITTVVNPSPVRKQSIPLLKNGLPIKSALKSPVVTADSNYTSPLSSQGRPSHIIRSHTAPTLSSPKFVHFNNQLEQVRLFLQGETPSCVAERDTIVDAGQESGSTSNIKLTLNNWSPVAIGAFQPGNIDAGGVPLKVESIELSEDQSELIGTILIQNIAFHKHVSVRYTLDFWQAQSEVSAEFKESIPGSTLDRFTFKIALNMEKSMVEKMFCFAVRYQVIGREFWDSNNGMNYQVECKRVVVVAPPTASDLSKQMNSILLGSCLPDYSKPVLKKKHNRYDLSSSLSAAYSQPVSIPSRALSVKLDTPVSQTAYRPSEYIAPIQSPPGYHHSLYASSPKFMSGSYLSAASPPDLHIGFEQLTLEQPVASKRGTRNSWAGRESESGNGFYSPYASSPVKSSSISIPTSESDAERPQVGSSSYVDLVDRYCFYESSPRSSPYSSYPSSPAPCIRG